MGLKGVVMYFFKKGRCMNRMKLSCFSLLFFSFSLLIAPLPLSAMVSAIGENSEHHQSDKKLYIYLDSDLAGVLAEISALDGNVDSPVHLLIRYIQDGSVVALHDEVVKV